jgi:peroxiredoxin
VPLLCDEDRAATKAYGVWNPIGWASFNTAFPAAFLIDAPTRRIRYAFVGSTQFERAPLDAILGAAAAPAE